MTAPVDICNQALDQMRSGVSVQSINPSDGTLAGDVMSRNYQPRVDGVSRAAHWNCLRVEQPLTILRAARGTVYNPTGSASANPPANWLYEYAMPSQPWCLRVRYVFPWANQSTTSGNITLPNVPLTTGSVAELPSGYGCGVIAAPFAVSTDVDGSGNPIKVILTNAPYAQCVYTARILDPSLWDSQFVDAVVMTLAAWTCEPIAGGARTKELSMLAAQLITAARVSDGNEGTQTSDYTPDWIAIRGGRSLGLRSPGVTAWDTLALPLGAV